MNDWPIHKYIPMEKLDLIQPTQVRILNYINPQRFYVYLQEKVNTLTKSQSNLQAVMNANPFHSSSYERDQAIAVLDDHSVWLRATVSELLPIASQQLRAYFVDSGDEQIVSLVNVRPLPKEFTSQSALAIPCRLYGIYPLADTWQVDDPVHAIFGSLMKNYANCKVCERKDQFYYEVDIDIPNIGNLGTYLFEQKLVSSRQIRSMNTISPAPFIEPVIRSDIPSLPLKDGIYIITHVYSAIEFYGHSLVRQRELNALHRHLETIYNLNQTNEQSLSVPLIVEGIGCVIQQGEQYHRVIIKHRESDTRVLVKLVDRGDELPVDISELLQLEQRYLTIPAFAQPFRLANYDDSQSTTTITRKFKRLMLNQSVQITQTSPAIKGFFPVRVQLADNSIVNDILLTNDPIPPVEISKPSIPERNRFGTRSPRPPPPVRFFREPRKINLDEIEQPKRTFSGWPNARPMPTVHFQAADSYKQIDFPRQTFDFVISHIENLTDFFIQLTCKELELNQLTDDLQKEHIRAPELSTNQLKPYQPCLAKSPLDDCWYRALILSNSQTDIRIRFIDFGDTHQIDFKSIRQLADKFALVSPYAYHCTLTNPQFEHLKFDKDEMISKCIGQIFRGKFDGQTKEKIFILRSETFERLFSNSKRVSCLIVHIDHDRNQFYIQDDRETMNKIKSEISMADNFPREENLQLKSFVIATYENQPYRARIEQIQGDNVEVYLIDYGNRTRCSKTSLKQCPNQLKTYRSQAKCCQLEDDDDVYLKKLDEIQDSDETQVIYLNKINEIYTVQLFINQECLTNLSLQSTATTVKERKRTNDEILSPTNSLTNIKRQKSQSETYRGILTHIDKKKKLVFFQLQPEAEKKLEDINEIIDEIVQMNQHNERYSIDDYVIAQFSEDNEYYRAKIESYSSETNTYSVYFLDYGNIDENVPINRLFPYSSRLNQFANQVRSYKLESYVWPDELSSLLNQELEFDLIDHDLSIISIKCLLKSQPKTLTANLCSTNQNSFYVHLLPDADALICEIDELLETHEREQQDVHQWKLNDLCMIFDSNENRYFRGRIQAIRNQLFDIQCIDYGNLLSNVSNQQMFVLKNPFLLEQKPLARQCRLYGVNDENQSKAIDEVIRLIPLTEQLTLTVDNQQNDTQCMFVMLFRNNKEIINDRYIEINQRTHSNNSSDSAIAADDESSSHEQQISSPIGSPQAESTHRYVDTITNQTIDFGENDPNTTIKDENNILES